MGSEGSEGSKGSTGFPFWAMCFLNGIAILGK